MWSNNFNVTFVVVDYNGFGMKHAMQAQLAARFAGIFSHHMPERLHKILLLNAPWVFSIMLKAVTPFVDPRTLNKIVPLSGSPEEILSLLEHDHHFPQPALDWLATVLPSTVTARLPPSPAPSLLLPDMLPPSAAPIPTSAGGP